MIKTIKMQPSLRQLVSKLPKPDYGTPRENI